MQGLFVFLSGVLCGRTMAEAHGPPEPLVIDGQLVSLWQFVGGGLVVVVVGLGMVATGWWMVPRPSFLSWSASSYMLGLVSSFLAPVGLLILLGSVIASVEQVPRLLRAAGVLVLLGGHVGLVIGLVQLFMSWPLSFYHALHALAAR